MQKKNKTKRCVAFFTRNCVINCHVMTHGDTLFCQSYPNTFKNYFSKVVNLDRKVYITFLFCFVSSIFIFIRVG